MEVRSSLKAAVLALTVVGIPAIVFAQNSINPKDFTTTIDNPFFPLVPNTTFVYLGTKEGSTQRDEFQVTGRTSW